MFRTVFMVLLLLVCMLYHKTWASGVLQHSHILRGRQRPPLDHVMIQSLATPKQPRCSGKQRETHHLVFCHKMWPAGLFLVARVQGMALGSKQQHYGWCLHLDCRAVSWRYRATGWPERASIVGHPKAEFYETASGKIW